MNSYIYIKKYGRERSRQMNKLDGLYELKKLNIPTVNWKKFTDATKLDDHHLWTIRTAVYEGNDLDLPKLFGADAQTAEKFARRISKEIGNNGIVIYYPYLIAQKSGNLQISGNSIVIEAIKGDLVPLLRGNAIDVTYIYSKTGQKIVGDEDFLSEKEINDLLFYAGYLTQLYGYMLAEKRCLQLEFSFASECGLKKEAIGAPELIFFEIRTV